MKQELSNGAEIIEKSNQQIQKYVIDMNILKQENTKLKKSLSKLMIRLNNLEDFNETENDLNVLTKKQ